MTRQHILPFDIREVISVSTQMVVPPAKMNALFDLVEHLTGAHQTLRTLPAVLPAVAADLRSQHPELCAEQLPEAFSRSEVDQWVQSLRETYGDRLDITGTASARPLARTFHIGDVYSAATGIMVSPRYLAGLGDLLTFLEGRHLYTHELPAISRQHEALLRAQHPDLYAEPCPRVSSREEAMEFLETLYPKYGEEVEVCRPFAVVGR